MKKSDLYVGGGILGIGTIIIFILMPFETLIILTIVSIMGVSSISVYKWAKVTIPLYVQTNQLLNQNQMAITSNTKLLSDSRHKFESRIYSQINKLHLPVDQKKSLFKFVLSSEDTLKKLLVSEKIPVYLSDIKFGSLTITFRLKLREFSRANLEKLLKMDSLIGQALSVESVRMIQGSGFIDIECSSLYRIPVDLKALQGSTNGSVVALGMDSMLQPVTIDISQHGLISAIAPPRKGKTTAIKSMLYLLKNNNPGLNIVIVAFKSADWKCFDNVADIILDSDELKQFEQWLVAELYRKAKSPDQSKWVIVFDDLVNLLSVNPELVDTLKQLATLGAGCGISSIVSTQFVNKDSGGSSIFANSSCRLLFKPSSNLQGSRDGGMAGLGLENLSSNKGDALLVVDGEATRITTCLVDDKLIFGLDGDKPDRDWRNVEPKLLEKKTYDLALHPMEILIEKLNGWMLEDNVFDWEKGKFTNRSEAIKRLGKTPSGREREQLTELEQYIFENHS